MRNFLLTVAIAGLLMNGLVAQAANPTPQGTPDDGILDVIVNPSTLTASLDTNGLSINGFILNSLGGHFTGTATLPFAFFQTNTANEASVGFATPPFSGSDVSLGQLYSSAPGSGTFSDFSNDLAFTYTVENTAGLFDGNLILGTAGPPPQDPATIGLSAAVDATVIRGGTGTLGLTVDNTAASGAADLNYSVSPSTGAAGVGFGSVTPTPGALGPDDSPVAHTVSASTTGATPLGANTVTFTVADVDATNSPQTQDSTLTVLDHSAGSFVGGGNTLSLDFGNVLKDTQASLSFGISNAAGSFRAGLDLTNIDETDPDGKFSTNAAISNQAAGVDSFFDVFVDLSEIGDFSGQFKFDLADAGGFSGAAAGPTLTLDVTANVVPEPSSIVLLVLGVAGLWVIRRRRAA